MIRRYLNTCVTYVFYMLYIVLGQNVFAVTKNLLSGYPRIAQFYYKRPPADPDSFDLLARYDLLVVQPAFDSTAVEELRARNPNIIIVVYENCMGYHIDDITWGAQLSWDWFLYTAPAVLVDSVDTATRRFRVSNPEYFRPPDNWYGDSTYQLIYQYARIDSEIVRIDSLHGDTLFVARRIGWRFPHPKGSPIRGIDSPWSFQLQMNFTLQCPGFDGIRWCDKVLQRAWGLLSYTISGNMWLYDGIYYDMWYRVISDRAELVGNSFDFDMDGVPDYGGNPYAVDSAWFRGLKWVADSIRSAINLSGDSNRYLLCNNESGLADVMNGRQFEAFPYQQTAGIHSTGRFIDNMQLFMWWSDSLTSDSNRRPMPRLNIIRPRCDRDDVRKIRFALACCLMGDGFIARGEPTGFVPASELTWYDEYSVDTATGCADTTGMHKHWLGMPMGPPECYEGDSSILIRRFEHGIAVMAWTDTPVTVNLGAEYMHIKRVLYPTPLDSTIVTHVTLRARDGQIGDGIVLIEPPGEGIEETSAPIHVLIVEPNIFGPKTTIRYTVHTQGYVELKIYDLAGRIIKTLINEHQRPGNYKIDWYGRNNSGEILPSGMYFVVLNIKRQPLVCKKVLFIRKKIT